MVPFTYVRYYFFVVFVAPKPTFLLLPVCPSLTDHLWVIYSCGLWYYHTKIKQNSCRGLISKKVAVTAEPNQICTSWSTCLHIEESLSNSSSETLKVQYNGYDQIIAMARLCYKIICSQGFMLSSSMCWLHVLVGYYLFKIDSLIFFSFILIALSLKILSLPKLVKTL